jgi:hypothetical protein
MHGQQNIKFYVTSHRPMRINLSEFFLMTGMETVVETSVCSPLYYFARLVARGILILLRYARPEIYERWKYTFSSAPELIIAYSNGH